MNNCFHARGAEEYRRAMKIKRRTALKAQFAGLLSTVSWLKRLLVRLKIPLDLLSQPEGRPHGPSPYTLW